VVNVDFLHVWHLPWHWLQVAELDTCPYVSEDAREMLSEASAPPIREVQIGLDEYGLKIGGEQVMFRHEKTFFNQPGIGVLITDEMADDEVARVF
jgi:acetyl-CoA decarbonylase/synthase complex subunit gamma